MRLYFTKLLLKLTYLKTFFISIAEEPDRLSIKREKLQNDIFKVEKRLIQ
jgi:hypothetical protein